MEGVVEVERKVVMNYSGVVEGGGWRLSAKQSAREREV